jgi:hypothetical protein
MNTENTIADLRPGVECCKFRLVLWLIRAGLKCGESLHLRKRDNRRAAARYALIGCSLRAATRPYWLGNSEVRGATRVASRTGANHRASAGDISSNRRVFLPSAEEHSAEAELARLGLGLGVRG